ncbi:hypothetical protein [Pararhodospirillum photometricum]|nr:hypothetical protein [Pararhodospirillum photometricum]
MNELIVFDTPLVPEAIFGQGDGIEEVVVGVEARARIEAQALDVSTPKGRKAIASLAYAVARSKTALDDAGKALVADIKAKVSLIDADRKFVRDRLDALRDEVRAPLDAFEAREKARVDGHETAIARISSLATIDAFEPAEADASANIAALAEFDGRDWEEFSARAAQAIATTRAHLETMLAQVRKRDAERAELARLKAEEEQRKAREAEEQRKAEEAERVRIAAEAARREAEEKAAREAEEARRKAEEERSRIEREKLEAEERAKTAERKRAEEAAKAKAAKLAAEEEARRREVEAAERERRRIEAQQAAEAEERRKREADQEHRRAVNRAAMAALVKAGLTDDAARVAITAIAKGDVPGVRVEY